MESANKTTGDVAREGFILDEEAHAKMRYVKERGSESIRTKLERMRQAKAQLKELEREIAKLEPEINCLTNENFKERMVIAGWEPYEEEFVKSAGSLRAVVRILKAELYAKYDCLLEVYGPPDSATGQPTMGVRVIGVPTPEEARQLLDKFGSVLGDCSEKMEFKEVGGVINVNVERGTVF